MLCSWSKWSTHSEHGPEHCLHKPSNGCWQNHFLMFCLWLQRHLVVGEGTPKDLGYEVCLTSSILSSPSLELALATHCDLKQTILWKFDKTQKLKSSRVFWHFIAALWISVVEDTSLRMISLTKKPLIRIQAGGVGQGWPGWSVAVRPWWNEVVVGTCHRVSRKRTLWKLVVARTIMLML